MPARLHQLPRSGLERARRLSPSLQHLDVPVSATATCVVVQSRDGRASVLSQPPPHRMSPALPAPSCPVCLCPLGLPVALALLPIGPCRLRLHVLQTLPLVHLRGQTRSAYSDCSPPPVSGALTEHHMALPRPPCHPTTPHPCPTLAHLVGDHDHAAEPVVVERHHDQIGRARGPHRPERHPRVHAAQ